MKLSWNAFFQRSLLVWIILGIVCQCACSKKVVCENESYVEQKLREAAESIRQDLALLTGSNQRNVIPSEATDSLANPMSLVFDGPIELALTMVAAEAGYRLQKQGKAPQTSAFVRVSVKDRPCQEILEEIGKQTGQSETLLVSQADKTITLQYLDK